MKHVWSTGLKDALRIHIENAALKLGYPQPYLPKKNFVAQGPPN